MLKSMEVPVTVESGGDLEFFHEKSHQANNTSPCLFYCSVSSCHYKGGQVYSAGSQVGQRWMGAIVSPRMVAPGSSSGWGELSRVETALWRFKESNNYLRLPRTRTWLGRDAIEPGPNSEPMGAGRGYP